MRKIIILLLCFSLLAPSVKQPVITIIPLGKVNKDVVLSVSKSISSFYGYKIQVSAEEALTNDLLAKSRTRYNASSILKKYSKHNRTILLTEKDIACSYKNNPEWGVLGLSYISGNVSIVSTFRLKKNVSYTTMLSRAEKISIHELGHSLGLSHCSDKTCLMQDACGKISTIDKCKKQFCKHCKDKLI